MPIVDEMFNKTDEIDYNKVLFFNRNPVFCELIFFVSALFYWCFCAFK